MSATTIDADVRRLVDQALTQGFPEKCTDRVTMAKIAAALNGHVAAPRQKKIATGVKTVAIRKEASASGAPIRG